MKIFKELNGRGHEQIVFFNDPYSGLKGIIAIHNTTLGPALGGCRMWNYKSEEEKERIFAEREQEYFQRSKRVVPDGSVEVDWYQFDDLEEANQKVIRKRMDLSKQPIVLYFDPTDQERKILEDLNALGLLENED